jgi:hypothetical protein
MATIQASTMNRTIIPNVFFVLWRRQELCVAQANGPAPIPIFLSNYEKKSFKEPLHPLFFFIVVDFLSYI